MRANELPKERRNDEGIETTNGETIARKRTRERRILDAVDYKSKHPSHSEFLAYCR